MYWLLQHLYQIIGILLGWRRIQEYVTSVEDTKAAIFLEEVGGGIEILPAMLIIVGLVQFQCIRISAYKIPSYPNPSYRMG
jgi:hypothetical protein